MKNGDDDGGAKEVTILLFSMISELNFLLTLQSTFSVRTLNLFSSEKRRKQKYFLTSFYKLSSKISTKSELYAGMINFNFL